MTIKQFKDAPLAHYSYAIVSNGKMAVVDPARNPMPYYKYAEEQNAKIVAVFETHPHADFVSSHVQIHKETGAKIYVSKLVGAEYEYEGFDDGNSVEVGKTTFRAINTPGHSPDSITVVAEDEGKTAMFTGDTLFIGDVGRPDLREKAGNMKAKRVELAKDMYNTIRTKFNDLPDDALVYPAHGAGSLCGKNMSDAASSTLGNERKGNWAFKEQTEEEFVEEILKDQPFIPSYFGFDVDLNKIGAAHVQTSKWDTPVQLYTSKVNAKLIVVDTRDEKVFKAGHLPNSFNIMARSENDKYETWLGAIVQPEEAFYLVINSVDDLEEILERTAKIGYEKQIKAVLTLSKDLSEKTEKLDLKDFKNNPENYTIVDIRNKSEVAEGKIFKDAITVPLNELRDDHNDIPSHRPVVVHCAGGYRSAAGSSILNNIFEHTAVYDLSDEVNDFK
ncbi:rhodanese-like domain-containing protein [Gramella sp. AN32]|uniref:MBL fold metallo-hydrolase n=1 Tax=Christiangramia antarctica TaxID=2058158 RepID=A0ABW5X881_9FLAO|nr:rhodanese-like domain-containing protein [Gramella sp. AN32]MCM4158166.1 MBL fold metallo-hydrolase [Gramella sp. AN32]